jgi:hypothetical protein
MKAVLLYEDEELWLQAQKSGIDIINHRYLRGLFEDDFKEKIKWLQANLQQHQFKQFYGIIAQHHTVKVLSICRCGLRRRIKSNDILVFWFDLIVYDGL